MIRGDYNAPVPGMEIMPAGTDLLIGEGCDTGDWVEKNRKGSNIVGTWS